MPDMESTGKNRSIPEVVKSQEVFFRAGGTRLIEFRKTALRRLEESIQKNTDEFLSVLSQDLGKPEVEAYLAEIYFVLSEIRFTIKNLNRWAKARRVGNPFYFLPARSEVRQEPLGPSLVIAPWNYPIQLSLSPLIAAVAAGNCVVLKPSEMAGASADLLAKIIRGAFDPAHVTVVQGGKEVVEELLTQPFKFIFYTGSGKVGKIIAKAAAEKLIPVVLELGGKCPCIVGKDIDLVEAAERIIGGKFFNAGQTCMAPDFVLIPNEIRAAFVEKAEALLEEWYGKSGQENLARIINANHFERIRNLVSGEVVEIGEDVPDKDWMAPRILPEADWDDPVMQEEIFGPVLPVIAYDDLDELLERFTGKASPLALYLFSRDEKFQEKVIAAIPSGSVGINDTMKQATNLKLPFGGVGNSGMGRYRGEAGFEAFSYARSITKRYLIKDVFAARPPYDGLLEKMRKILK